MVSMMWIWLSLHWQYVAADWIVIPWGADRRLTLLMGWDRRPPSVKIPPQIRIGALATTSS